MYTVCKTVCTASNAPRICLKLADGNSLLPIVWPRSL